MCVCVCTQALALLANLLMKDYVKWRGALFHRFALALVDPSPAVRHLAEHLMGHTLVTKVRVCMCVCLCVCVCVVRVCVMCMDTYTHRVLVHERTYAIAHMCAH